MAQTTSDQLSKPIMYTIGMIIAAMVLTPVPGIDVIFDIAAVCLVGSKWLKYAEAAKEIASTIHSGQAAPNAAALYDQGLAAFNAKNYDEAHRLYKLSAEAGNRDAMNNLGAMYHDGNGRTVNFDLAAQYYEQAITKGERQYAPKNIALVALEYFVGKNVAKDLPKSAYLSRVAAETGLARAQFHVGGAYEFGWGLSEDVTLARHWYSLAAAQGDEDAKAALARLNGEQSEQKGSDNRNTKMTRAAALELLELKEGATKAEMKKAYIRLMQQVHPDKGGSNYFAKQLNEAREVLGF